MYQSLGSEKTTALKILLNAEMTVVSVIRLNSRQKYEGVSKSFEPQAFSPFR